MKKFLVLSCAFLICTSIALAATTNASTVPVAPVAVTTSDPLTVITKSIDRRIAYFNRYVKARDMEGIRSLVSDENKDFYANFLKYVETAPVFSVKRDASQSIIKTPQDEYTFPALLSLGGKEAKISMTFLEEDSDAGKKWLVVDSNLHIIGKPLAPAQTKQTTSATQGTLSSSALSKGITLPNPTTTRPITQTPPVQVNTAPTVVPTDASAPLASAATTKPATPKIPTATPLSKTQSGLGLSSPVSIAVGIVLLLGILGGALFVYTKKRKYISDALLAAEMASIAGLSATTASLPLDQSLQNTDISIPSSGPEIAPEALSEKSALDLIESNVSLVETTPQSDAPVGQGTETGVFTEEHTIPAPEVTATSQSTIQETPTVVEALEPQTEASNSGTESVDLLSVPAGLIEASESETVAEITSPDPQNDMTVLPENPIPEEEISPETPGVIAPGTSESSLEQPASLRPDPLFSTILSPEVPPETSSLFGSILGTEGTAK